MVSPLAKHVPVDNIKLKQGNPIVKHVPVANSVLVDSPLAHHVVLGFSAMLAHHVVVWQPTLKRTNTVKNAHGRDNVIICLTNTQHHV